MRVPYDPPTPPAMKDLRADSDLGDDWTVFSSMMGIGEAGMVGFVSSLVTMVGVDSEEDVADALSREGSSSSRLSGLGWDALLLFGRRFDARCGGR